MIHLKVLAFCVVVWLVLVIAFLCIVIPMIPR